MAPNKPESAPDATISRRRFMQAATAMAAMAATPSLAACGDSGSGGLSEQGKPVPGGPETAPNPDVPYPDDYVGPIASHKGVITIERAELTVVVPDRVSVGDWMTNEFTKWYEERTNVHVNFKTIAGGSHEEQMTKVNAMISSGDLPDVFMGMGFTPSQLRLYGEDQKLLAPLGDIIDEYCPETRKIFQDYPDARSVYTSGDGNIYTMPNIRDTYHTHVHQHRAWIYQPWLDELGLKMPKTLDEFTEVLTAFKTMDPNGNGKADEVAFTSGKLPNGQEGTFDEFIMGSFLYNPGGPWLVLDDGTVDVVYNKPGWREGLKYLNKLYVAGLVPKSAFTQSSEQLKRQGNSDPVTLGVVRQYYWNGFLDIEYDDPNARWRDYVCVPTLAGPDGFRAAGWDYYRPFQFRSLVVTTASKIPEIAAMWGDGLYELEATLRAGRGVRDTNWRWASAGQKGMDGRQAVWSALTVWPPDPGLSWHETGPEYYSNDIRLGLADDPESPSFEPVLYHQIKKAYYPYREPKDQCLPNNLAMSRDDAGTIADTQATLANHVLQSMAGFALGDIDPNDDRAWEEYVDTLDSMGLARLPDHSAAGLRRGGEVTTENVRTRPPNVVLVITDDLGWGDVGCHGNRHVRTPHLDRMHAESARLTRYCSGPVCTPARAALMTGRHPYRTRAIDTYVGRSMLDPDERVLPEVFRDAGYATGIFGKWHLGDSYPMRPVDRGFDQSLVHRGGGLNQPANIGRNSYFGPDLIENGRPVPSTGYCTDIFATAAIAFIEQQRDDPFFCYLATNAPHGPHQVGEEWIAPHRAEGLGEPWARLYGMVDNIDHNLGRVMAALASTNLLDETVVIFTSDHGLCGSALFEGRNRYNAGLKGRKGSMYEGGIRVPMFWRAPGRLLAGHDVDRIANPIDVLPTLADICGLTLPDDRPIDGVNLRPLLSGELATESWPERTLCMQWHRGDAPERFRNTATITQRWKAYWHKSEEPPELFDLSVDPTEEHNVSADHPDILRQLEQTYADWFNDVSATRPDNYAPPRIVVGAHQEPTTWLTRQDWRLYPGVPEGWDREHPGYWLITVAGAGTYRIGIDLDEQQDGVLHFRCGDERFSCPTHTVSKFGFTVPLKAGPQELEAFVTDDADGDLADPAVVRTGVLFVSITAA